MHDAPLDSLSRQFHRVLALEQTMVRKLVMIVLLAILAACTGSITAADGDTENRGGSIATSGG
jgi:hypothetical protein